MSLVPLLRASRPRLYFCIVAVVAFVTMLYRLHVASIFACPADGYGPERFLESCNAEAYGIYSHGAFFFGLEPEAERFARDAEVMFLGNSREQFAFSTSAVDQWFESRSIRPYLLGFAYHDGHVFAREILRKIKPQAKAYVINMDGFFASYVSPTAEPILKDRNTSLQTYENKRWWQSAHKNVCGRLPLLCGKSFAVFRDKQTGRWSRTEANSPSETVSEDSAPVDPELLREQTNLGVRFLNQMTARRECIILTLVPTVNTPRATAQALAASLKLKLVAPVIEGLQTFDGSHLDQESAERWSAAFLEEAGPRLQRCMSETTEFSGIHLGTSTN